MPLDSPSYCHKYFLLSYHRRHTGSHSLPPPNFFSHRSRHGHVFNNNQLASQTSIDRSICVPSCNFWTKDTWFGPELVFSHVWLVVYSKDLPPVHCIHTFEGCAGGITLNFSCALHAHLLQLQPPHCQLASNAYVYTTVCCLRRSHVSFTTYAHKQYQQGVVTYCCLKKHLQP